MITNFEPDPHSKISESNWKLLIFTNLYILRSCQFIWLPCWWMCTILFGKKKKVVASMLGPLLSKCQIFGFNYYNIFIWSLCIYIKSKPFLSRVQWILICNLKVFPTKSGTCSSLWDPLPLTCFLVWVNSERGFRIKSGVHSLAFSLSCQLLFCPTLYLPPLIP